METLSFQDGLAQMKENRPTPETAPEAQTEEVEAQEVETPEEITDSVTDEVELEENTEEIPTVEMPNSWSKDDTEDWNSLTPAAQEKVAKREGEQRSESSRRHNELLDQKKALDADAEKTKQKQAEYVEALEALKVQKPSVDLLDEDHEDHNPDEWHRQNAHYEKSQLKVGEARQELQDQQSKDFVEWQAVQSGLYKEKWPEFLDTEKSKELHNNLINFASKEMGITTAQATQTLLTTDFKTMSILNKAMRFDQLQAKAKTKKVTPKSKSLKAGSSNPGKSITQDKNALATAFAKDRSPAAAAALMKANRG